MNRGIRMHDPTAELEPVERPRIAPAVPLSEARIALMDLGKIRSDDFLDSVERELRGRGLDVRRFAKPTNAKPADAALLDRIAAETDVVVEALAD